MCCFLTIGVKFKFHCLHQFFFQKTWKWFTLEIIITQNIGTHSNELVINLEEYENIFRDSNSAIMIFAFLFNGNQLYKEKKYLLFCMSWFPCGRAFSPKEPNRSQENSSPLWKWQRNIEVYPLRLKSMIQALLFWYFEPLW